VITTPASLSTESIGRWLGHQPEFLHVSWTVDSLEKAAAFFAHTLGAGPFFSIENVVFDRLAWDRPSSPVWNHSTALGAWGDLVIEIQQMHEIKPQELAQRLSAAPNSVNHIGYVAGDYRAESDRLDKLGMPRFLDAKTGEIEEYYHWAPELGVALEVHKDTEFIRNTHVALRQAARDWDGKDPLRPVPTAF
jgi:Glyoxalase/Bleomycin resistance protein/Dioxygenase superfamily